MTEPTRTTLALIHLQVLVLVAGKETVEYDFRQRALGELEELGLVHRVRETRRFTNGDPRLRADLTDEGCVVVEALIKTLARRRTDQAKAGGGKP